jgi:hypothetical protein
MACTSYELMGGVLSATFACSPGYIRLTGIDTHGDFYRICYQKQTMIINNETVSFITDIDLSSSPTDSSMLTFYITITCVIGILFLVLRR